MTRHQKAALAAQQQQQQRKVRAVLLGSGSCPQLVYIPSSKGLRAVRPYRGHVFVRTGFRKLRFRSPAPCKHAFAGSQPACSARASIKTRAGITATSLRARLAVAAVLQRLNGLETWEANLKTQTWACLAASPCADAAPACILQLIASIGSSVRRSACRGRQGGHSSDPPWQPISLLPGEGWAGPVASQPAATSSQEAQALRDLYVTPQQQSEDPDVTRDAQGGREPLAARPDLQQQPAAALGSSAHHGGAAPPAGTRVRKSMSSQLEQQSHAAQQTRRPKLAPLPASPAPDIDSVDADDPLTASSYVSDIYAYYRRTEANFRPLPTYMARQVICQVTWQ